MTNEDSTPQAPARTRRSRVRSSTPLNQSSQQDQEQRFTVDLTGGGRNIASVQCIRFPKLGTPQNIFPEGIRNWIGLLCASIVGRLPMEVRDVFVQEVRSLVLYTGGSASMLAKRASPCFVVGHSLGPVPLPHDPTLCSGCSSPSLHLGAYLILHFFRSLPECAGLPGDHSAACTVVGQGFWQRRPCEESEVFENSEHRVAAHFFTQGTKLACRQVRMAP